MVSDFVVTNSVAALLFTAKSEDNVSLTVVPSTPPEVGGLTSALTVATWVVAESDEMFASAVPITVARYLAPAVVFAAGIAPGVVDITSLTVVSLLGTAFFTGTSSTDHIAPIKIS